MGNLTVGQKLGHFISTAKVVAKQAVTGEEVMRPEAEQERLMAICNSCEFLTLSHGVQRCSACGCVNQWLRAFRAGRCAKGKW